jgi:hypothetical protein
MSTDKINSTDERWNKEKAIKILNSGKVIEVPGQDFHGSS